MEVVEENYGGRKALSLAVLGKWNTRKKFDTSIGSCLVYLVPERRKSVLGMKVEDPTKRPTKNQSQTSSGGKETGRQPFED